MRSHHARAILLALLLAAAAPAGGLLAVFSHPDDELFSAGTLARAAAAGLEVQVVYTTSGDRGQDHATRGIAGRLLRSALRARVLPRDRETETRKALRALGITTPPVFLRLGDGEVTQGLFRAADRIEARIRHLEPTYVLTMGPQGVTGHRDHVATSAAVSVALQRLGPVTRLLHVVFSPERAQLFRSFWRVKTVAHSVIDHRVPIDEVASARAAALAAHRTQFTRRDLRRFELEVLRRDHVEELREVEARGPAPALAFLESPRP